MPIYEYQCQSCGHDMEKLQRMSDEPLKDCPDCGKPELRRLVSAAGFRLKGAGWYETDFKKGGQKKNLHDSGTSTATPAAAKASTPGSTAKTESKPKTAKPDAS